MSLAVAEASAVPSSTSARSARSSPPSCSAPRELPDGCELPLERLESQLCTLAGRLAAATCQFLVLLAAFDSRQGWRRWETHSCAHWLSWKCGIDLRTAQEQVRVARALRDLPMIRAAFAAGRISYSKVRAIVRVATPLSEPELLQLALGSPAGHVERQVRRFRTVQRLNPHQDLPGLQPLPGRGTDGTADLGIRWRWDDDGTFTLWGRLSPADGAALLAGAARAGLLQQPLDLASSEGSAKSVKSAHRTGAVHRAESAVLPGGAEADVAVPSSPRSAERGGQNPRSRVPGPRSVGRTRPSRELGAESSARSGAESGAAASGRSREGAPIPFAPPSDLGPALVTMANQVRAGLPAPIHAPAAEVVVVVDAATLGSAARRHQADQDRHDEPGYLEQGEGAPGDCAPGDCAPGGGPVTDVGAAQAAEPRAGAESCGAVCARPGRIDDGPGLPDAVLLELACSGRIRLQVTADGTLVNDGRTLDLGRAVRRPNGALLAALWRRDRGCVVPGCGRTRFLHAHHVRAWAVGGDTSLDNLVLLCGEHHRALHEDIFAITALGRQRFRLHGSDGTSHLYQPAERPGSTRFDTHRPTPCSRDVDSLRERIADPAAGTLSIAPADLSGIPISADIDATTIQPDWDGSGIPAVATAGYLAIWKGRHDRAQRRLRQDRDAPNRGSVDRGGVDRGSVDRGSVDRGGVDRGGVSQGR